MPPLTVALPKGRLLDPALQLLSSMGIKGLEADTRRLLLTDPERDLRFIFLKPADIPTYVEYGAADLGIVGKDILAEQQPDVYEPVDLGFGFCRLVVAEPRDLWERDDPTKWSWVRVATKYPTLTERYFSERGIQVEMIHLDGSIERGYGDLGYTKPHGPEAEWNIKNDIPSAQKLFASGVPIFVMPLDSTQLKLDEVKRAFLFQAGTPITDALTLLYHLAGGGPAAASWKGVQELLDAGGVTSVPAANCTWIP